MDPAEVEFLAEKESITVVPKFSLDRIYLIGEYLNFTLQILDADKFFLKMDCSRNWKRTVSSLYVFLQRQCPFGLKRDGQGDIGPFSAGLPIEVPLWLAVNLKQRQKCRIRPPEWMDREKLQEKKQEEMDSKFFIEMPSQHYMEITQLLLKYAPDDIPHADETRTLIKDLWDLRMAKLRSSIDTFVRSDATHAKLNHLTLMELNTVRPFLTNSLDQLYILRSNLSGKIQATQE